MDKTLREDGEISDSENEWHISSKTAEQSDTRTLFPPRMHHNLDDSSSDEEGYDDNKLSDTNRRKISTVGTAEAKRRKLLVWSNVLMEQQLSKALLKSTNVESDEFSDKISRGVESYTNRHLDSESIVHKQPESDSASVNEDDLFDIHNDGESRNVKARLGKRRYEERNSRRDEQIPEEIDSSCDDRTIAKFISVSLEEPKVELLHRVSRIFGKDRTIELYRMTLSVEDAGGLLTQTGVRRTPGGVFIFLLKNHKDMTKEIEKDIFAMEKVIANKAAKERQLAKRIKKYGTRGLSNTSTDDPDSNIRQTNEGTHKHLSSCNENVKDTRNNHGANIDRIKSNNHCENNEDFELMEEPDIELGVV